MWTAYGIVQNRRGVDGGVGERVLKVSNQLHASAIACFDGEVARWFLCKVILGCRSSSYGLREGGHMDARSYEALV